MTLEEAKKTSRLHSSLSGQQNCSIVGMIYFFRKHFPLLFLSTQTYSFSTLFVIDRGGPHTSDVLASPYLLMVH